MDGDYVPTYSIVKVGTPKFISYDDVTSVKTLPIYFDFHRNRCRIVFKDTNVMDEKGVSGRFYKEILTPVATFCNRNCEGLWSYHLGDVKVLVKQDEYVSTHIAERMGIQHPWQIKFHLNMFFELKTDLERFMSEQAVLMRLSY